jgi:ABC-2 type transport system permease protein
LVVPLYVFLSLSTLTSNTLGFERQSLTTLFLFPIDPKRILWGKNLPVLILGVIEITVITLIAAFITQAWNYALPAFALGFSGMGVVLGVGNFTSIFLPMRMRPMRRGFQSFSSNTSTQNGCLRGIIPFASLLSILIVLIPVGLALFLPLIFNATWIWVITIPASLIYGIAIYLVVTSLVAPRLSERMPEILAITTREE